MTQLSVLIHQLQQVESSEDAGALPVCLANLPGDYQIPQEASSVSISFETYKDAAGGEQIGRVVKIN